MGAAFKWAVQHTKKEFAILKEEIGHHLQNLRAQEPTYRRDSDEKSPPPRNKDAARSEGESGASPTRKRLDAAKIGPHTVRERAQFILVPGERGFFTIRKAAKEA